MTEKTYSFKEIADQLGVSESDIIEELKDGGFLDSDGKPTDLAISEGILCTEQVETGFSSN